MDHPGSESRYGDERGESIDRTDVLIRALYSALFAVLLGVLDTLLGVIVVFQLVFSLVTETLPSPRLQRFANGVVAFYYQVLRYLTHNDSVIPFPFSDLPTPQEPTRAAYAPPSDETGDPDFR
jgi:hypothetical protein